MAETANQGIKFLTSSLGVMCVPSIVVENCLSVAYFLTMLG